MNVNEVFPSRYLTAADLNGKEPTVVIASVEVIDMESDGRKDRKLVASFEGKQKQLVMNKTNSRAVADMYGEDTDDWIGKAIKLVTARVDFQGRRVSAIRIDPPSRTASASALKEQAPPPQKTPQPAAAAHPGHSDFDDGIPFAPNFL